MKETKEIRRSIKKAAQNVLASVCIASMAFAPALNIGASNSTSVFAASAVEVSITRNGGWLETAYVEWSPVSGASGYNVYYKSASDSQFKKIDGELVRKYSSFCRADVLGLEAGNYVIKVVPIVNGTESTLAATTQTLAVKPHTREGFAFSSQSPIGGYNNDGTVQSNATILYVTPSTANTVTANVITGSSKTTSCTGLVSILAARQKGYDKTPLIIRLAGQVKASDINGLSNGYIQLKGCYNVTLEGVGEDATAYQWGILVRNAHNIEIRNIGMMLFPDDAISMDTGNQNIWVHNNDIFYGSPGSDADQVKGDGSSDIKGSSDYITVSYNHYWDSGKVSLCGLSEPSEFHVTYHHNWFDHSDSRHPRIRKGTIHIYNNYFDGNSKYGVGNTSAGSAFVEANYFRNCKYPMLISKQGTDIYYDTVGTFSGEPGGMTKAYNNIVEGAKRLVYSKEDATQFDAYLAESRNEKVPSTVKTVNGSNIYNNFDTSSAMYTYKPDEPSAVKGIVTKYAGRVNGGDFSWTFTTADEADYSINAALKEAIMNYKPSQQKKPDDPIEEVIYGDVNGDSTVDVVDATMLKSVVIKKKAESIFKNRDAADMNNDGVINSIDYLFLKQKLQSQISK